MRQVLCPIVVGRDAELALLEEHLSAVIEGSGRTVFLLGEAGIGKSRLARETLARARERGMKALTGRSVQGGSQIPLRPLAEALHGGLRTEKAPEAPEFRPYRRALARMVPEWRQEVEWEAPAEASPILLHEAFVRLLSALAAPTGLVLVIEDLHWADSDTLAAVEYLADNIETEPVLSLATVRTDEPGPASALAETLVARRIAASVPLRRLSGGEVEAMVRASLAEDTPASEVMDAVRTRAEGVPFVAEEMLSEYVAAGGLEPGWDRALPPTYRHLVRRRLEGLSPESRRIVLAGAVLGRSFEWELLGEIVEMEAREVLAGLGQAVDAQLVQTGDAGDEVGFRFRHALVREALLADLLPPERAELSLRAADVIEARFPGVAGEWCERAADLRELGGDRPGAARLLLEAGRRAMARWALASAEATLERARELAAEDPWLVAGTSHTLLEALALAGKMHRVREVGEQVLAFFDARRYRSWFMVRMVPVHLDIARGVAAAGAPSLARTHLDRAKEMREGITDESVLARISSLEGLVALAEGNLEAAATAAAEALDMGERLGQLEVMCEALEVRGWEALRRGDADAAGVAFARLRNLAQDRALALWETRALLGRGAIDRCRAADPTALLEARRLAASTDAISTKARIALELGRTLTVRFEREAAREALDDCVESCRRYGLPVLPRALVARAGVGALLLEPVEADLEEALGSAGDDPTLAADAAAVRALSSLIAGDRREATRLLDRAVELARSGPPADPRSLPGLWALLHADDERTRIVRSSPDAACRATRGYLEFSEAVALGRGGRTDEAMERFRHADGLMEGFPWDRHVGRLLAAERAGGERWGDPVTWARESLAFFEPAGHRGLADAAKRVLRDLGAPVPRRGRGETDVPPGLRAAGVTSREMDVLSLVAEGLSNREIAERLYLSRRTVETHIGSLMRKTGMADREHLGALLREGSERPTALP